MERPQQGLHRTLATSLAIASAGAAVCVALKYGFDRSPIHPVVLHIVQLVVVLLYIISRAAHVGRASKPWIVIRRHSIELGAVAAGLAIAIGLHVSWAHLLLAGTVFVVLVQLMKLLSVGIGQLYGRTRAPTARLHPARLMLLSFAILIVAGGLLLSLPKAMSIERRLETGHYAAKRVFNCFFTATSATCVTGLVVYDTEHDFTRFGQAVILVLVQMGGLGIMVFGSVFGMMLRRQLSLRESLVLQDVYSHRTVGEIGNMVKFIFISTLLLEALGSLCLYDAWPAEITDASTRWFYSIFHAVSAFCNAGFTLSAGSLTAYRELWPTYTVIMPAIVLGGLGFPVLADVGRWGLSRSRRSFGLFWGGLISRTKLPKSLGFTAVGKLLIKTRLLQRRHPVQPGPGPSRLSLHSKLVLAMSLFLIVVPAGLLFLFESTLVPSSSATPELAMHSLPTGQRMLAALFQSVTSRTAGFHTVSLATDDISTSSLFVVSILMFIGGSPASTAGGVKTVAIAILLLGTLSTLRRREHVEAMGRQIPSSTIRQAGVVIMVMFCLVSAVVLVLSYTESAGLAEVLFESVSACGTVGLSTGLTPHLTIPGKLVIMLAMFAGRLGPLTLLIALAGRQQTAAYDYPVEHITIG